MDRQCPKCGAPAVRTRRSQIMRSLTENLKIYRYRCKSSECNWQTIVIPSSSKKKLRNYLLSALGFVIIVGSSVRLFQILLRAMQD